MKYFKYVLVATLMGIGTLHAQYMTMPDAGQAALNTLQPAGGCTAELKGFRPKVYIANFYVTYGKKDMGRLIGDYIAQRFEADGRFDVISREAIEDEMRPLLKKKIAAEKYLQTTVELAEARQADCVIFGRISKAGKKVSFLVRMAAVKSGENLRKVDTDVERKEAIKFLEGIGDSFTSYFVTAPVLAQPKEEPKPKSDRSAYITLKGLAYFPLGNAALSSVWATGGAFEFGVKGLLHNSFILGAGGEYHYYTYYNPLAYAGSYGDSAFGILGFEVAGNKTVHLQLMGYFGFQFGQAGGTWDVSTNWYGLIMAGPRLVIDLGKNFSLMTDVRYSLTMPGTSSISGVNSTLGFQIRF